MNSMAPSSSLVARTFEIFAAQPPDLRQTGDSAGEVAYVRRFLPAYERTVSDVLTIFKGRTNLDGVNIVELGAFLGVVSKSLALAGATVVACDIPEFFDRQNVRSFYERMSIRIESFNLRHYKLPFENHTQDCVIACETFEHLNFNPLPVFAEINRVLKVGGFLYIAMPNGAYFLNRVKFLFSGKTPGFSVEELFLQLDASKNMVVGLHWKEYSLAQTLQMVRPLGFDVVSAKTVDDTGGEKRSMLKRLLRKIIPGGDTQVVVFTKTVDFSGQFVVSADS
jgi:SAM-dependent methyltransferase